jgi:hypothetical protein
MLRPATERGNLPVKNMANMANGTCPLRFIGGKLAPMLYLRGQYYWVKFKWLRGTE